MNLTLSEWSSQKNEMTFWFKCTACSAAFQAVVFTFEESQRLYLGWQRIFWHIKLNLCWVLVGRHEKGSADNPGSPEQSRVREFLYSDRQFSFHSCFANISRNDFDYFYRVFIQIAVFNFIHHFIEFLLRLHRIFLVILIDMSIFFVNRNR